jgi:hypothetical protein
LVFQFPLELLSADDLCPMLEKATQAHLLCCGWTQLFQEMCVKMTVLRSQDGNKIKKLCEVAGHTMSISCSSRSPS